MNGEIQKGFHIHHKDENKSNNSIENLELIEKSRHLSLHMTPERREFSKLFVDKIRPLTKEWHRSEEGIKWHKEHAYKSNFGKWEKKEHICKECAGKYESSKRYKNFFCSHNCKCKFRKKSGKDNILRCCEKCKKDFSINKYGKTRFCTRKCANTRGEG